MALFFLLGSGLVQAQFAGGNGSADSPWQIATRAQLHAVRDDLGAHYEVVANIDLSASAWTPIGTEAAPFAGNFDGGHHIISGLNIHSPGARHLALFAFTQGASLGNVVLKNVDVSGDWYVAGLVARATNTVIVNSSVTGELTATGPYAGGIAASARGTVITGSFTAGRITGTEYVGGLVGIMVRRSGNGWLLDSYSTSEVKGTPEEYRGVGGLVGDSGSLDIHNSYFAGFIETDGTDFQAGAVTGYNGFGDLANSFWNADNIPGLNAIGQQLYSGSVENLVGLNTDDMTDAQTFMGAGWNFTSVWAIDPGVNNGYPHLNWQTGANTDSPPLPFARLEDRNINIDAPFTLNLADHFVDPDGLPLDFAVAGDLPQGLVFDAVTGVISGTPTRQDSHTLEVTATDTGPNNYQVSVSFTLHVQPAFVGEGTVESPWEIDTAEKLDAVRNVLEAHFVLTSNIDLSESAWSEGWQPIGSVANPFEGSFDGNGFSISGLVVNAVDGQRAGLFGRVFDAELRNIDLIDVQVTGYGFVGGLAGAASRSIITDTRVSGTIAVASGATGGWGFGGLVGFAEGAQISQSEFSGTVTGRHETGGLVGVVATSGVIRDTRADASVSGTSRVGGLVGFLYAAQDNDPDNQALIETSHAHGPVTGDNSIGGLVGETMYATVINSHAAGEVVGDTRSGGLVGYVHSNSKISDVYFQGSVSGRFTTGGLVGGMIDSELHRAYVASNVQSESGAAALVSRVEDVIINSSFWHEALANGQAVSFTSRGDNTIDANALSAAAIQTRSTFVDAGWDFAETWDMQPAGGLPYQRWAPEFFTSPPVLLDAIPDALRLAGRSFDLALFDLIVDPEGGELTFTVSGLPLGVSYDEITGLISGSTQQWGDHAITIIATNDRAETLEVDFTLSFLPFTRGDGALNNRWHVETAEQLRAMGLRLSDHYMLVDDIDLGGGEWIPVGTSADPFTGSLNGNYNRIDGLTINTVADNAGLFGSTENATLTRIRIEAANVKGGEYVGILVGRALDTVISQVAVSGEVSAVTAAGGLAGSLTESQQVSQIYVHATISANATTGGIAGTAVDSAIRDGQISGSVESLGGTFSGGLVASLNESKIDNTYSVVRMVADAPDFSIGALAGLSGNNVFHHVYWNQELNPAVNSPLMDMGGTELTQVAGRTLAELKDAELYPVQPDTPNGWDFDTIWGINPNINNGLPYLRWMRPNAMPTLTRFNSEKLVIDEDTPLWLRGHILMDASDAADEDGGVAAFVIKSVVSGSLLIGHEPFDAVSNNAIDMSVGAYWTPDADANGLLPAMRMVARDNRGVESATEVLMNVQVTPVNDAPVLLTPIPDQTGTQDEAFSLALAPHFDDVDGDTLQFVVTGLPDSLSANGAGLISGTPTNADALASPYAITVTVSDDSESVSDSFELIIVNVNDAPVVLGPIEAQAITAGDTFAMDVSVYFDDPDNDTLTFAAQGLPDGLDINTQGIISGTTARGGSFTVTITAEDPDGAHVSTQFELVASAPPVLQDPIPNTQLPAGNTFELALRDLVSDPEGGELTFTVSGLPAGVTFDPLTGVISGTTQQWGDHPITIEVTNERGDSLETTFTLSFLPYTTGDGSSDFGWRVETAEQLRAMQLRPDDHYILLEDIDLESVNWIPVGDLESPFTGSLVGDNYTIRGLYIDTDEDNAGLFGVTEGATLTNIRIESAIINGRGSVGILVGRAIDTAITRASVSGMVEAQFAAGGVAGILTGGHVSQIEVNATVSANDTTGGIAAAASYSTIRNAQVSGTVESLEGDLSAGLVASIDQSEIENTYSLALVVSDEPNVSVGALAGHSRQTVFRNVFWNKELNPALESPFMDFGGTELNQTEARTLTELKSPELYPVFPEEAGGWDFDTIWGINPNINNGLPYLRWTNPNAVPTLTAFDDTSALEIAEDTSVLLTGQRLMDASDAADENGDIAAFIIKSVESGTLTINGQPYHAENNNEIRLDPQDQAHWQPATDANGTLSALTMIVRDNEGAESATPVLLSIVVTPVNDAPVLLTPIPDQTGTQDEAFSLDLAPHFGDVDGDTLQFVLTGLPDGLSATGAGLISGTPTNADALAGPYVITVTASDGSESVSDSFELIIVNVNDAPVVLGPIEAPAITAGTTFDMDVSVYFDDPDNDTLTFGAHGLPDALAINVQGIISGTAAQVGSFTVTITAEDPDGAHVSTQLELKVNAPPVVAPPVIDGEQHNVNRSGTITVTESGVLNGGNITGTINNSGTITGTVNLGAGSQINGGRISGTIRGNAGQPARINNAAIAPGSVLENVIISSDVTLSPDVELGSNVRFASGDNIPPTIDLTPALNKLQWSVGDEREVLDLSSDVLTPDNSAMSIIRSIQLMGDFEPAGNQAMQDDENGEIRVTMSDTRHTVLPVKVTQAAPEDEEGLFINSDGDIVLVTASRRVVVNHPVLDNNPAFREALAAMGLNLDFDARTNLIVSETSSPVPEVDNEARQATMMAMSATVVDSYYAGRPDVSAVPAHRSDAPGIHSYPITGLANVEALSLIFVADDGRLLEQDIAPVPAHWSALKQSLQLLPESSDVRIDTLGVISLMLDGQQVSGRVDYRVERHPHDPSGTDYVAFDPAGDVNGDGVEDFLLRYPNGDRQVLYVYP